MSLLLFRVHVSSLPLDMAPSQGLLLPSPCKEVSLMIDHHGLKVLQVNLALCLTHNPSASSHPKVFPVRLLLFSFFSEAACLYLHGQLWHPGWVLSSPSPRREVPLMVDHLHLKMSQVRLPWTSILLCKSVTVRTPSWSIYHCSGFSEAVTSTFTGGSGTQSGSSTPFTLQGSTAYGGSPQDVASPLHPGSSPYASVSLSSPQGAASKSSQSYQGYSVSQSQESQKWQPSATR